MERHVVEVLIALLVPAAMVGLLAGLVAARWPDPVEAPSLSPQEVVHVATAPGPDRPSGATTPRPEPAHRAAPSRSRSP